MEERNIMGELNMYRQLGLKPNFSEIGRRYGLDRHTVSRYWNEGGDVDDGRCRRPSGFDKHGDLIAQKAAMPGATKKAVHESTCCIGARGRPCPATTPSRTTAASTTCASTEGPSRMPIPDTRPRWAASCSSTGRRTCAW